MTKALILALATNTNTGNTVVQRDGSGNFSAGTITATLSGNSTTATTLATARTINGVSFNGSANITIADSTKLPLSGGTMTGAITFAAGQTWPTFNQNTTGSAATLATARTLTIGNTGKTFNGSANVSWSLAEIGAIGTTTPTLVGLREVRVAMPANDINLNAGNFFSKTISTATTFTVSNVPATDTAISFILDLTNAGSAAITWWSGVKWAGGTAPVLTTTGRDVLGFYTYNAGVTWTGILLAKDVK